MIIFSGVEGVEPQSETVWHQADKYHVPRIAFINKMDRPGADYFHAIDMMVQKLGAQPVTLHLPWGSEENFKGLIDLITQKAMVWNEDNLGATFEEVDIPSELREEALHHRNILLEAVVEKDDEIMEKYLAGQPLSEQEIKSVLRTATLDMSVVPVLCGSGLKNKGIQPLLNAIVDYLPSPPEVPPIAGISTSNPGKGMSSQHL